MSIEKQKGSGNQFKKVIFENARKEIKKALGEGYKKIDSNETVEVYQKGENYFSFNKKTGNITKLPPKQQGGTFNISGLPGI